MVRTTGHYSAIITTMSQDKHSPPDHSRVDLPDDSMFISTREELADFSEEITNSEYIAVDTEFVRDKTYYPRLCLIQIASPSVIACIDPIAVSDLSALQPVFTSPEITKVFHAARQDLEILYQELDVIPSPIFDTQVAATLLGLGEQIGYANLVKSYLGLNLSKQHARADWEQRPLSEEQLAYAADDVRYLVKLYPLMLADLDKHGRHDWLNDDFAALTDPALYQIDTSKLWQRISGNQKLRRKQLAVLQELCIWREKTAMDKDKPRKWILADNNMIAIATQMPASTGQLSKIRGLNKAIIDTHGQAILTAVKTALSRPEEQWPKAQKRRQLDKNQEATIDALMAIAKLKAQEHSISVGAIVNRNELEKLVLGETNLAIQSGWRYSLIGKTLVRFLNNELSLIIKDNKLCLVSDQQ
jgi:ribonuclease D